MHLAHPAFTVKRVDQIFNDQGEGITCALGCPNKIRYTHPIPSMKRRTLMSCGGTVEPLLH